MRKSAQLSGFSFSNIRRNHLTTTLLLGLRCCDRCQRYKKRANHNASQKQWSVIDDVATDVKDTKREQITTFAGWLASAGVMLRPMSKIQKESKSQLLLLVLAV